MFRHVFPSLVQRWIAWHSRCESHFTLFIIALLKLTGLDWAWRQHLKCKHFYLGSEMQPVINIEQSAYGVQKTCSIRSYQLEHCVPIIVFVQSALLCQQLSFVLTSACWNAPARTAAIDAPGQTELEHQYSRSESSQLRHALRQVRN